MRTTTALLSLLLLTGGLHASTVRAASVPTCDCRSTCSAQFRACSADALAAKNQGQLVCRTDTAKARMACAVVYSKGRGACTGCGPDNTACTQKARDERTSCTAPLRSTLRDCLAAATTPYLTAKGDCKVAREMCVKACN